MADMEKVIKGLEYCKEYFNCCDKCPYWDRGTQCMPDLANEVLSLLKEQETVEPIITDHIVFGTSRKCSKCNQYLFPAGRYCPHCGRSVKWE